MPFPKIRLKKSKQQYNVASKSAFVITVELLDNAQLECTLTAESTGRDCMDNVCQRIGLQQADLFGLRYFSRRHTYPKIRWVELDRPLKKQLDKYAQEPYLFLGVMFYVNDVSLLEDEVTRYHYFLQLKMDVVDGRLRCNFEQAIVLASYSLQAEIGDHDPEKHTVEYLKQSQLLPKPMITQSSEERICTLLEAIISQHSTLQGIAQQLAEVYYIVGSQQLDGYGQECFLAKDERGQEVLIGASLSGIVIRRGNVQSPQFLVWQDITNLVNHKRYFGIECQNYEYSVQFILDEPDAAKYVWKMCVLQHTFYKMHSSGTESNELNITLEHHTHSTTHPAHQVVNGNQSGLSFGNDFSETQRLQHFVHPGMLQQPPQGATIQRAEIESFHAKQTQRLGPIKMNGGHFVNPGSSSAAANSRAGEIPPGYVLRPATSNVSIHPQDDIMLGTNRSYTNLPYNAQPITSARSVNDLDQLGLWPLGSRPQQHQNVLSPGLPFDSGLPPYRPAPDYETAIRNKYGSGVLARIKQAPQTSRFPQHSNNPNSQLNASNSVLHTSQPTLITDVLTNVYNNNNNTTIDPRFQSPDSSYHVYATNLVNANPSSSYSNSTPELNKINQTFHQSSQQHFSQLNTSSQVLHQSSNRIDFIHPTQDQIVAELLRLNIYKPPPPYPGRSNSNSANNAIYQQQQQQRMMASTSTPDLAGQFVGGGRHQVSSAFGGVDTKLFPQQYPYQHTVVNNASLLGGSSPDLVSRRTLGLASISNNEKVLLHRTLENLHHFSTGEIVRPPGSTSPEQSFVRANGGRSNAFSTEELNNVYHLENANGSSPPKSGTTQISHLIHDHRGNNFLAYSHQVNTSGVQMQSGHQGGSCSEPIYQNQAELRQQMIGSKEPIYQNLPVYDRMMSKSDTTTENEDVEPNATSFEKNVTGENLEQGRNSVTMVVEASQPSTQGQNHVSRVAITNSREDLSKYQQNHTNSQFSDAQPTDNSSIQLQASAQPKKSVTKVNIGPVSEPALPPPPPTPPPEFQEEVKEAKPISENTHVPPVEQQTSKPSCDNNNTLQKSQPKRSEPSLSSSTTELFNNHPPVDKKNSSGSSTVTSISKASSANLSGSYHHLAQLSHDATNYLGDYSPKTPSSKPRGVRRKWGFHFGGSKTGSLKSLKSMKSASSSRENLDQFDASSSSKFGPMMLATLHGLTRSRPDLLTESLTTFSAFTTPSRMPKNEIGSYLEAKLAEGEVLREFETIPKKKLSSDVKSLFKTATMAENVPRNRFKDVLPYDDNRVRLAGGDKENKSGYINASHVSATVGDQQRFYIASQGPLPQTVGHFWQMVFQSDVHIIVMLTDVVDQSGENAAPLTTSNCIPYWPQKNGSTLEVSDFRISKQFTSMSGSGCYTTSTLHLVHMPTKRTRTLWHLHYTDWGDHGCPTDVKAYLEFLEEINSLRQHIVTTSPTSHSPASSKTSKANYKAKNPPILVHCSAGVGRTGVAILCDILLYCADHNVDIDIPKILGHLRQQRMLMVQTVAQYKFAHMVLIQYLKQSRLI